MRLLRYLTGCTTFAAGVPFGAYCLTHAGNDIAALAGFIPIAAGVIALYVTIRAI